MSAAFAFGAVVVVLLLWAYARETDRRKAVIGCVHEDLRVLRMHRDWGGGVFTICRTCGHQAQLPQLLRLPDGSFHLREGDTEAERLAGFLAARARQLRWLDLDRRRS